MGKGISVARLSLACLLAASPSPARSAEPAPSPDAALPPQIAPMSPAEQQREIDRMLQQPMVQQRYQPMESEIGIAVGVFFADFALRTAETMLGFIPWLPLPLSAEVGGVSSSYITTASLISGAVAVTSPLLNAFVAQAIGNAGRYRRPFVPILVTSYVSCFTVEALTLLLAFSLHSGNAAGLVYFFGSMAGSISMAVVQNAVREPLPEGTTAQPTPAGHGLAFAF